jgi:membrane peptidoglycan carboxypeptidase
MKPIVYLAAFRAGMLNLDTVVPDEPISVPNGTNQDVKWISNYDGQFEGLIPARIALAESRNAVAIWIAGEIGIASVLRTARSLGIQTPLRPYVTTALGASGVTLMELANAYRTMASGILTQPYVIRTIVRDSGQVLPDGEDPSSSVHVEGPALSLIQEGMRGVVHLPTGTTHALDSSGFPMAVMGKTGTTNEFRTRSLWAPLTSRQGLPSQCVSASMTAVPLEQEKLARGWRSPCSKKSRSESMPKS